MIFQFILLQVLVFAAVIYFLKRIMYGNTESAISRLSDVYQDLLKKQAELTQKIEAGEKEYQLRKEEALGMADKLQMEALAESRKKEDEILKKARTEAENILAKANAAKEDIVRQLEANMNRRAIDFSMAIIKSIFGERTMGLIHEEMVRDFVEKAKGYDLSSVEVTVEDVILRTSRPLKKEETERLNTLLMSKLNRPVRLHEAVDQDLLAGVVMQFGTLVLDGSLANALKEAANQSKENT